MKTLKKNPLVQRMEDMTFPIIKPKTNQPHYWEGSLGTTSTSTSVRKDMCTIHPKKLAVFFLTYGDKVERRFCNDCLYNMRKRPEHKNREWLKSVNDDNGFTLMSRLAWRVVAVGVFVGAVIISIYIYGHVFPRQ